MIKKKQFNVIISVINIFLFFLLIYSYVLKEVSMIAILPALCSVYIVTYYWEKQLVKKRKK